MLHTPLLDVAGPGITLGLLMFGIVFLAILTGLIIIVETTCLQLTNWGPFRDCLKASAVMNLASTLVGFAVLGLVPALRLLGLLIAWALSVIIEGWVLSRFQPGNKRRAFVLAGIANLASYGILLLPAYLYGMNLT